jgi:hypothetical protein
VKSYNMRTQTFPILFTVGIVSAFRAGYPASTVQHRWCSKGKRNRPSGTPATCTTVPRSRLLNERILSNKNDDNEPLNNVEEEYLDDDTLADIEAGQPSQLMIMQDVSFFFLLIASARSERRCFCLTVALSLVQFDLFQQLLGINIFTYVLAAAIVFFLIMNMILGPGWLGNTFGIEDTGTFAQTADSLPDAIDLSNPDYLL